MLSGKFHRSDILKVNYSPSMPIGSTWRAQRYGVVQGRFCKTGSKSDPRLRTIRPIQASSGLNEAR
jgi:hypothetical protein